MTRRCTKRSASALLYLALIALLVGLTVSSAQAQSDPLPSWNDGSVKQGVIDFVGRVTSVSSKDYVPPSARIAVFDNDGTLWSEQPYYFQLAFAFDRLQALEPEHPEWKETQPFKAALEGDVAGVLAGGEHALLEILMATHAGMTTDEFEQIVSDWIFSARHPQTNRLYTEMVYQPMLELLTYLRANDFKTYIVSGGGIEFMRAFTQRSYGVPPEQVIGSSIKVRFEMRNSGPVLVRLPEIDFLDDKAGKPVAIHKFIGQRPIFAFGNSDGDLQMLQWTAAGKGLRFIGLVHHSDDVREWAYDRNSAIGRLDKALSEAQSRNWTILDMKRDWKIIFPFDKE